MKNKTLLTALFLTLFGQGVVMAKGHCACSKECAKQCANGKGEKCQCKTCDCAKTGKCEHGKCEKHEEKSE